MDLALVTDTDAENPTRGDLRLVDGQIVFVTGADAIAQHVRVRLRWLRGEWFLDERTGLPYFDTILAKGTSRERVESLLRRTILQTPGVAQILRFALRLDGATRTATVDCTARTTTGATLTFEPFVLAEA